MNPSSLKSALIIALACAAVIVSAPAADLNVLIIGSTKDSGERHNSSVWDNDVKPALTPSSKPFSPNEVRTQLQNILAQDGRGTVNVTLIDRYASHSMTEIGWTAYSYNLATWFHHPFPAGAEAARWANLRGEAGTVWDYVVLIGDPYTMEYTPGLYAQGVAKIAEEVAKGSAQLVLLMPWPGAGSTSSVNHYKEVVYRTGRSGGYKVAPAALAWQACGSPTSGTSHPSTAAGAYIAAASIYSSIYNQSAAASGYVSNDANANTTFNAYTNNNNASHYTGAFSFQNPYLILGDKRREVHMSEKGTSTEEGFKLKIRSAILRSSVAYNDGSYSSGNNNINYYSSDTPEDDGLGWPTANPMPIAFNWGRDGLRSEFEKRYETNPSHWQLGFGYYYQNSTWSYPVETANDLFIGQMQQQDNDLANRMLNEGPTARNMPTRSLWAQIHKAYPTLNPMRDSSHLSYNWDEAVGTYMYTLYSGRCPLDPKPATDDIVWTCRKIGYETAWRLGNCQTRAPGFKVMPSAAAKKSIVPSEKETMTVQFILPPKQDVTVNVSISNTNAAVVGSKQLLFTPQNYDVPQSVVVAGLPGSAASESFNVVFTTVSTDEVYNGLNDSWSYAINRNVPTVLTRVDKGTSQVTANQNLPLTINLNTAGATSSNTTLAGPSRGTATWSGSNVIYTPGSDFVGKDGFFFATNSAGILSVGYIEITVTSAVPNGMVSYRGNGSVGGAVPIDSSTYAQNASVTVRGNTGNLIRVGYNFNGWNTAANESGTSYNAGSTFTMGASGVLLYAKWISAPTYTVSYKGNTNNGGAVPADQIKTNGVDLTLATNSGSLTKNGYTFAGWNTAANGTGTNYSTGGIYSGNANITLYAKWMPNNYTVTFNANGGVTPSPTSKVVTYASPYGTLATTSRPGYAFEGWFTAASGGTKILSTTNVTITNNQTLHAQWTAATSYAVSYNANSADSGAVPANQEKLEGVTLTLAANSGALARTGYAFAGWNTAANGSGTAYAAGASYTANASAVLYAQWTAFPASVTTVPNVVGLAQATAGANIVSAKLLVGTVTSQSHATVPAGAVISQSPSGGSSVAEGTAVDLVVSSGPASGGVVFSDNFEPGANPYGGTTQDVASYTVANTSKQTNAALWVRSSSGFGSDRGGLIDESENGGVNFTDPVGSQAYGFRYTNSGLTTAAGLIGALAPGTRLDVSFDVVKDGFNAGTDYEAYLVAFNAGAARNAVQFAESGTAAVLARAAGNVAADGNYHTVTFSYVVGDDVVDNNGEGAGAGTTFLSALLGKDIALRFDGASNSANIDNVRVSVSGSGGPALVVVPDVLGLSQAIALADIAASNLAVGTVSSQNNAVVPAGAVISQSPSGGASVAENSSVNLVISLGPVMATVPNVVGLAQASAGANIVAANLVVGSVTSEYSDTVSLGDVISQGLASGASVPIGSMVDLVVSLGTDASPKLVRTTVPSVSNTSWTTVSLGKTYNSPVIVATPIYPTAGLPPVVTRITNVTSTGFDLKIDRADGLTDPVSFDVSVIAVDEGVYTQAVDGVKMEAVRFTSTVTAENNNWVAESRSYQNGYTNPVVVGQVMSANDADWSAFWSMGNGRSNPVDASNLNVGKHVGEDPDITRADETIGYIVIESGNGTINGIAYEAGLGTDTIMGFSDSATPYAYALSGGLGSASAVAASVSGMDGADGSWAVLSGSPAFSATGIGLHVCEDKMNDAEQNHTDEQVGYIVFE